MIFVLHIRWLEPQSAAGCNVGDPTADGFED